VNEKRKQVKSDSRVANFGEVFTNKREVNAIIDLVSNEALRIESRFLEPACGEGQFLISVLERKVDTFRKKFKKFQHDFEVSLFTSVSSIYGIDILLDNVQLCRESLFTFSENLYRKTFTSNVNEEFLKSIHYVISKNIVYGDALTMKDMSKKDSFIAFTEWSLIKNDLVKPREYQFSDLMAYQRSREPDLFSDLGDEAFIPPIKIEHPYTSIYELHKS
jgi:hypothetical protein